MSAIGFRGSGTSENAAFTEPHDFALLILRSEPQVARAKFPALHFPFDHLEQLRKLDVALRAEQRRQRVMKKLIELGQTFALGQPRGILVARALPRFAIVFSPQRFSHWSGSER